MRLFSAADNRLLFSWTVIERAIRASVESGARKYTPPKTGHVADWQPTAFEAEKSTLWEFPRRGQWAVHSGDYRGNWPPQVARNLIERYTMPGGLVVDAFAGGGTTLVEAWLTGRRSIGLDISRLAIQTCKSKLIEMDALARQDPRIALDPDLRPRVFKRDTLHLVRSLHRHTDEAPVELLCLHPPYLDALTYTPEDKRDLSRIRDPEVFKGKMRKLAKQASTLLDARATCAILIGDVRKNGQTIPLGFDTLSAFLENGFELKELVVKKQYRDRSSEFYYGRSGDGLLMAHEYLLILARE